jgi:hypothetical protein
MPLVTLTVRKPKSAEFKADFALIETGPSAAGG